MNQYHQNMDLAQLQAIMQTFETACSLIQTHVNPASAESTILALSQSARPYQTCQFILENSQLANARFQAAGAMRDAAMREWGFLDADEKRRLLSFCWCYISKHADSNEGYVIVKVAFVAAQMLKRGWLDFSLAEKESFFLEVKQAVSGSHGLHVQFAGIKLLESLVSEFSPSTSTAMGLPREFHEQCRISLERDYLKSFYSWVQHAALYTASRIIESDSEILEAKVCAVALRLILQILNWDFPVIKNAAGHSERAMNVFVNATKEDDDSLRRSECVLVQPGPLWREVLISSGHVGWLLDFYGALRQKFSLDGYWIDCPLAVCARKLLVQFCSITGSIFPADAGHTQKQHLVQLLTGIVDWMEPVDAVARAISCGKSESELLDGCRALMSLATVTTPLAFDELLKSLRPYGTITLLASLMSEIIKHVMENHTEEETWSWVARDILLDTWTAILMHLDDGRNQTLPPEAISSAANLFQLIVQSELKAASASASTDDDEYADLQASISAMDERLSSYALIARAAIEVTVPFLTACFLDGMTKLHQGRGTNVLTETLEELYSLLLITGHVLADEGRSETPLVPKAIESYFSNIGEVDQHPVVVLCGSIIRFAEQSLDPEMRTSYFSPRLMEAIVWFLGRWSSTYLMPIEESRETKSQNYLSSSLWFCGNNNQGKAVLDIIVRVSFNALVSFPGEKDLQDLTCLQLLHGLVKRKNVIAHLVSLDSWRDLANAFANERFLLSLNGSHQRSLAQTLAVSASCLKTPEEMNLFIKSLTSHMIAYLVELSSNSDLKTISQQPDVILLVSCLLDRLRGVARASEPRTQKVIYEVGLSVKDPILVLLRAYKDEPIVVYLLLKYVNDWVEGQIIYLEAQETATVVGFCKDLLQLYSSQNIGKISLNISSSLRNEADAEKHKDLRALLKLLSSLCSKDMVIPV